MCNLNPVVGAKGYAYLQSDLASMGGKNQIDAAEFGNFCRWKGYVIAKRSRGWKFEGDQSPFVQFIGHRGATLSDRDRLKFPALSVF